MLMENLLFEYKRETTQYQIQNTKYKSLFQLPKAHTISKSNQKDVTFYELMHK